VSDFLLSFFLKKFVLAEAGGGGAERVAASILGLLAWIFFIG